MAKDKCRNHPTVFSSGTCKTCAIPLCDQCKVCKPEGIFCSEKCWGNFVDFQKRISAHHTTRNVLIPRMVKLLVLLVILVGLAWFVIGAYDISGLGDIPRALKEMWMDFRGLF